MEKIGDVMKGYKFTPFKPTPRRELISQIVARLRQEAKEDGKDFPAGQNGWMMVARQLKTTPTWRLACIVKYEGKFSYLYWKIVKETPRPEPKKSNKRFKF